jgi:hypothetical protein
MKIYQFLVANNSDNKLRTSQYLHASSSINMLKIYLHASSYANR